MSYLRLYYFVNNKEWIRLIIDVINYNYFGSPRWMKKLRIYQKWDYCTLFCLLSHFTSFIIIIYLNQYAWLLSSNGAKEVKKKAHRGRFRCCTHKVHEVLHMIFFTTVLLINRNSRCVYRLEYYNINHKMYLFICFSYKTVPWILVEQLL